MKKKKRQKDFPEEEDFLEEEDFPEEESKHKNIHHKNPTSRGGPKEEWNEYRWFIKKHRAYHQLADNRFPSEFIARIKNEWTLPYGKLDIKKLGRRKFRAWQEVFSTWSCKKGKRYIWSPQKAIRYIEKKFLPAEIRFLEEMKEAD